MPKYLTVVYTIHDEEAFEPTRKAILDQFRRVPSSPDGALNLPFAVTAFSMDHELRRVHWMEQAVEHIRDGYKLRDTLESISGHVNIGEVRSLKDLGYAGDDRGFRQDDD